MTTDTGQTPGRQTPHLLPFAFIGGVVLAVPCGVGTPEYIGCGYYCCAARRTQLTAHWSLRRAHTDARAAVLPGLRPGHSANLRPGARHSDVPPLQHSMPPLQASAGLLPDTPCPQCRPSAGTPCPQCSLVPAFGRALRAPVCRPSAGEWAPFPSALWQCLHHGLGMLVSCIIPARMLPSHPV